ncbi:MAG TPA: cytochrome c oxidase assembly protein [Alphaproteobacteria bacterium]|nr:cytochrome c oxidase assembly protein [Rhodospirillaceae bacterium]HRJ11611.1 cytochrome c oxidase assembly protein [Alphaproteobacteria bacterium]
MSDPELARRNGRIVIIALVFVFGMLGLSFAAVPLYRLFCQVTGLGGTPQTAAAAPTDIPANTREITIRFDGMVDAALPWEFKPEEKTISLKIGQTGFTNYTARSLSQSASSGVAVYNVNPLKAGKYFVKTQCFCFNDQTLAAGEAAHMPIVFYVDPKMLSDPNMRDVQEMTLSYRFYQAGSQKLDEAQKQYQDGG